MAIVSSGQITITDLSDAPVLNAWITSNVATTQVYNNDTGSWNPSYGSGMTVSLGLTKAGSTTSVINNIDGYVSWTWTAGTTTTNITSTTNTANQYLIGSKHESLVNKLNVPVANGAVRIQANGNWRDPITGLLVPFYAYIDLNVIQLSKSPATVNVYAPNGDIFRNANPNSLVINADYYKGNSLYNGTKSVKWFEMSSSVSSTSSSGYDADGGLGWKLLESKSITGQSTLTVNAVNVVNVQTYKCIIAESGNKVVGFKTIMDYTDPILCTVESTAGNVFKNSEGTTTLKARLYRNGEEIDTGGTQYTYKWSMRDKNGILNANFGGSDNQYKTGKTIVVNASDVKAKSTYIIEVNTK